MFDSSTFKALVSTILTFAVIIFLIGAVTNATGQDTASRATAPAVNPYENVEADAATAAHNQPTQPASTPAVGHNTP